MKILILGAGFGGLELATRLSDEVGTLAEVTLIDKGPGFVFGFSKLDVMFGKHTSESVFHPYESLAKAWCSLRPGDDRVDRPGAEGCHY